MKICRGTTFSRLVLRHVFMCDYEKSCFRVILVQSKILFSCKIWGIANSHFLRTAGPHSPDSPGHIKRTVLEISRAERGLRPANQYRALSQKAMPSQSVR